MPRGKCKLCLQVNDLQNSHLMPSSLFKKSRTPGASNPNPLAEEWISLTHRTEQIDVFTCDGDGPCGFAAVVNSFSSL
jgi:hypothetical protein